MRRFVALVVSVAVCWSGDEAGACPAPRPTAAQLTLVSDAAGVPADGALLVQVRTICAART